MDVLKAKYLAGLKDVVMAASMVGLTVVSKAVWTVYDLVGDLVEMMVV